MGTQQATGPGPALKLTFHFIQPFEVDVVRVYAPEPVSTRAIAHFGLEYAECVESIRHGEPALRIRSVKRHAKRCVFIVVDHDGFVREGTLCQLFGGERMQILAIPAGNFVEGARLDLGAWAMKLVQQKAIAYASWRQRGSSGFQIERCRELSHGKQRGVRLRLRIDRLEVLGFYGLASEAAAKTDGVTLCIVDEGTNNSYLVAYLQTGVRAQALNANAASWGKQLRGNVGSRLRKKG